MEALQGYHGIASECDLSSTTFPLDYPEDLGLLAWKELVGPRRDSMHP
jgi:hypothetical protein